MAATLDELNERLGRLEQTVGQFAIDEKAASASRRQLHIDLENMRTDIRDRITATAKDARSRDDDLANKLKALSDKVASLESLFVEAIEAEFRGKREAVDAMPDQRRREWFGAAMQVAIVLLLGVIAIKVL